MNDFCKFKNKIYNLRMFFIKKNNHGNNLKSMEYFSFNNNLYNYAKNYGKSEKNSNFALLKY